eukprot:CAMPEP_0119478954 /NCGR_PEP_ID=MMETSP1344-20130328/8449_1 /TAXON_ID=236787 /ORGANISM="Florenciella parvula, Strain CCMP2471" /LENGTH=798 /DNA_ID=CAMNT_0007513165 /DNA_START=84 /DNA_END=2480 /DNA_ORIENTATION=+
MGSSTDDDVMTIDGVRLVMVLPGIVAALLALLFVLVNMTQLSKLKTGKDIGKPKLDQLSKQIKDGARAFLMAEYYYLAWFVAFLSVVLLVIFSLQYDATGSQGVRTFAGFIVGAALSASAGWMGMMVATDGNVRTTVACIGTESEDDPKALPEGLAVAFKTGSIMGFTVVGLGLFGVSSMVLILGMGYSDTHTMQVMSGFGFGASAIALFARVAGGIYTKAADVGADLVGKLEAGIDEDDPHNPAVIADNVGDNVGDVAGMGADLFESYVGSIIAAATLGVGSADKMLLPFFLSAAGVVCAMLGCFAVSTNETGKSGKNTNMAGLMWALEKGMYLAGFLFVGAAAGICAWLKEMKSFGCVIIGLVAGMMIGKVTEYFTSFDFAPVRSITDRGKTGAATVVIQGLGVGMLSCVPPTVIIVAAILACAALEGDYGVAIAAVGMLATLGITLATDAYGPVADNAGGLAEMDPSVPSYVRDRTDCLDALGNTTAATGKGFAIGSAVLTSLSLLAAFKAQAFSSDIDKSTDTSALYAMGGLDIGDPVILSGVIFGAMLPYMFAALTMISVGKAAAEIIQEVRRQFAEVDGLLNVIKRATAGETISEEEDVLPESDRCVKISTESSVREMIAPGAYAILAPLFVGFLVGPRCLMGMLSGAISSGCMVAIMMSNAGGAWDNSKKYCEALGIKKTDQGKACIVGDTVGDPFKDTSGPSLNILIKLMSMVSLTIAPLLRDNEDWYRSYLGVVPLALFIICSAVLVMKGILTWKDPLGDLGGSDAKTPEEEGLKSTDIEIAGPGEKDL